MKKLTLIWLTAAALLADSCKTNELITAPYLGDWKSTAQKITVRTHEKGQGYVFTTLMADAEIHIEADNTANGRIGDAHFENAHVRRNEGNPAITGISYVIQCGHIGKISSEDPLAEKEIELWLLPIRDSLRAEIRYTEKMAVFPMGEIVMTRP